LVGKTNGQTMTHPFKCSKCDYVGESGSDIKEHWLIEH